MSMRIEEEVAMKIPPALNRISAKRRADKRPSLSLTQPPEAAPTAAAMTAELTTTSCKMCSLLTKRTQDTGSGPYLTNIGPTQTLGVLCSWHAADQWHHQPIHTVRNAEDRPFLGMKCTVCMSEPGGQPAAAVMLRKHPT